MTSPDKKKGCKRTRANTRETAFSPAIASITLVTLVLEKTSREQYGGPRDPKESRGIKEGESVETLRATPRRGAVSVNDAGYPIGQDHHRAKLTDHEVWLILQLIAEKVSQRQIAKKFEISRGTVSDIASGRRRGQTATGQRARLTR